MKALVEERFHRNFEERGEIGASLSVWKDGEEIISLARGWRDKDQALPWDTDTLVPVWSATKGPAAIATLLALHENNLAPHEKVSKIWPGLRAAAESRLTLAGLLSHQSGLPGMDPDKRASILSHRATIRELETQTPFWEPGKAHGYHPRTYGFLLDEIVRRVTGGTSLAHFLNKRLAKPLRLDFHLGDLTADHLDRLATMIPPGVQRPNEEELPFFRALAQKDSITQTAFSSPGGMRALSDINKLEYLQAGIPSLGGVSTASALGEFYSVLAQGGIQDGVTVLPKTVITAAQSLQSDGEDKTFMIPTAFTCGFMKDPLNSGGGKLRERFGPSTRAFGQPGAGGSHAFADPENGISFAYVMNQMEVGVLPNRKSLDLVEAVYS
ncbi:MAG: serine hydrolase [Verrucomicrobiales bacterium]|nr:serine hydrolase [Verrucomicrobiales bacterium]